MKTKSTFIIRTETREQEDALMAFVKALKIKFEITKEEPYNPDFVAKIQGSRQQVKDGKSKRMNLDEIWKE